MRRQVRSHPIYSFRFWFLVLVAIGATAAWKLDLLPIGESRPPRAPASEPVELGVEQQPDELFTENPEVFLGQSEPVPASVVAGPVDPPPRVLPRSGVNADSPFGPAHPEFVPVSGTTELNRLTADAPNPAEWSRSQPAAIAAAGEAPPAPVQAEEQAGLPREAAPAATRDQNVVLAGNDGPSGDETSSEVEPADANIDPQEVDFSEIDQNLNAGTVDGDIAAHRALSELYWQRPELRPQLMDRINETARRIYFQPQPHYFPEYVVQPGETLERIARKYSVSWEYLERLNRIQAPRMRAGQTLKVIKGPFGAVVDLSDYELTVHCHGHYVYRFPIGIGKDGSTPIGTFTVEDKVVNPPYNGPEGAIAADDPANPIGERWISLGGGYGIHGTIEPQSIGKAESRGCIRMHNSDVEIVYDLLTVGSEVVIQR